MPIGLGNLISQRSLLGCRFRYQAVSIFGVRVIWAMPTHVEHESPITFSKSFSYQVRKSLDQNIEKKNQPLERLFPRGENLLVDFRQAARNFERLSRNTFDDKKRRDSVV